MKWKRLSVAAVVAAAAVPWAPVRAEDDPTDSLIAEVLRGAQTDADRAQKLVEAAAMVEDDPPLREAFLERAAQYGIAGRTSAGLRAAEQALDALAKNAEGAAAAALEARRLDLYRAWYRIGRTREEREHAGKNLVQLLTRSARRLEKKGRWFDAAEAHRQAMLYCEYLRLPALESVRWRYRRASHFGRAHQRVAQLTAAIKGGGDVTARTALIRTYVVSLDDPPSAAKHITADVAETWRTYVPLAAGAAEDLRSEACWELARWYHRELAAGADPLPRSMMLARARRYYARFLSLHGKQDARRLAAGKAIAELARTMEAMGFVEIAEKEGDIGPGGQVVRFASPDALEAFRTRAPAAWRVQGGELTGASGGRLPQKPFLTYGTYYKSISKVTFRGRIVPPAEENFRFAVGPVNAILNWEAGPVNLFWGGGRNMVRRKGHVLTPGREHTITIEQEGEKAILRVDGQAIWETKARLHGTVTVYPAHGSTIAVREIIIDGEPDPKRQVDRHSHPDTH